MVLKKLFGSLVLGAALAFGANAQETPSITDQMVVYDRIYGQEEEKIKTAKEHFEFGKKLAEESRKNQALEYILEAHALAHLEKADKANLIEAYNEIFGIHEDNIQDFPADKVKYLELIIADAEDLLKKLSTSDKENRDNVYLRLASTSFKLGNIFEEEMKYREAVKAFYNAEGKFKTVKDPKNVSTASKRAKENAKFADEDDDFRKLVASENLTPDDRFNIGVEFFRRGEHGLARKYLDSQFGDKGSNYLKAVDVIEDKNQKIEDIVAAARLFEENSRNEKRTGVKARLLNNALNSYSRINRIAQSGSLEATEASSMVGKLKEELEKCGKGDLELALDTPKPVKPSTKLVPVRYLFASEFNNGTDGWMASLGKIEFSLLAPDTTNKGFLKYSFDPSDPSIPTKGLKINSSLRNVGYIPGMMVEMLVYSEEPIVAPIYLIGSNGGYESLRLEVPAKKWTPISLTVTGEMKKVGTNEPLPPQTSGSLYNGLTIDFRYTGNNIKNTLYIDNIRILPSK